MQQIDENPVFGQLVAIATIDAMVDGLNDHDIDNMGREPTGKRVEIRYMTFGKLSTARLSITVS